MDMLKGAQNIVDFATYVPLLHKATIDNDTPTPGYLYEEIIKMSYQSAAHRTHLIDYLLARLQVSSFAGKRKVVRILLKLTQKGDWNTRLYLRKKDGDYRHAASKGGPPDPLLGNTPQLFLNSDIQELLSVLFDPRLMRQDEEDAEKGINNSQYLSNRVNTMSLSGHGSTSSMTRSKYEGFGNTRNVPKDDLVKQVKGIVGRVITGSEKGGGSLYPEFDEDDNGNYTAFVWPEHILKTSLLSTKSHNISIIGPPSISNSMTSSRLKEHVAGRAGGGWESDEEIENLQDRLKSQISTRGDYSSTNSGLSPEVKSNFRGGAEEQFLTNLTNALTSWPVDRCELVSNCRQSSSLDPIVLLGKLAARLSTLYENKDSTLTDKQELLSDVKQQEAIVLLLYLEFGVNLDILPILNARSVLEDILNDIYNSKLFECKVKLKSRKMSLVLEKLTACIEMANYSKGVKN